MPMEVGGPEWFAHTLALALGMTVAEAKARISEREWRRWVAFYRSAPFDELARFHRGPAMLASLISAALGRRAAMREFLPVRSAERDMTFDEIAARLMTPP
jgi:hypothetical protein